MKYLLALLSLLLPLTAVGLTVKSDSGLYDMTTDKIVEVNGSVNDDMVYRFSSQMVRTIKPGARLILINSPGGDMDAGNQIIALIEAEKKQGVKIFCVVERTAASMAFNILSHCDVRLAVPTASLLFHRVAHPYLKPEGDERLIAPTLRAYADRLETDDLQFSQLNMRLLKMRASEYFLYADNNRWWTAKQLLNQKYLTDLAIINP